MYQIQLFRFGLALKPGTPSFCPSPSSSWCFSGLSEDEVAAIGEHEHIPQIAACALADYLLKQPHGGEAIRAMIVDDIHQALCAGRIRHAQELFMALRHFLEGHPEARAGVEI